MTKYTRIDPEISRRKFINVALGTTAGIGGISLLTVIGGLKPANIITPQKQLPTPGDVLVFADGPQKGQPVAASAVKPDQATFAYPQGEAKGQKVVRDGQQHNQIVLLKFQPSQLKPPTDLKGAPDGLVAYSAQCMHLGCPVTFAAQRDIFHCPCHGGEYDPTQGCKVIGGPPPKPLPQLPIKVEGGNLVVADVFVAPPFGMTDSEFQAQVRELKKA